MLKCPINKLELKIFVWGRNNNQPHFFPLCFVQVMTQVITICTIRVYEQVKVENAGNRGSKAKVPASPS
jgi:hypothetical protein